MSDHDAIVETLWARDIDAFVARDWSMVEADFDAEAFCGHARAHDDVWTVAYPTLPSYRDDWLRQAQRFADADPGVLRAGLRETTRITDLEVSGDRAVARKQFDGTLRHGGTDLELAWVTQYLMRRDGDRWLIAGFVGGLPLPGRTTTSML